MKLPTLSFYEVVPLTLWCVVVLRFIAVRRNRPRLSASALRQTQFIWGAIFCLTLASTVYHPELQNALSSALGAWTDTLPRAGLAIIGYLFAVHITYGYAPHVRPARNWPVLAGALTLGAYELLARLLAQGQFPPLDLPGHVILPDLFFDYYLLLVAVRVILPALAWAWRRERQPAMRLRFLAMLAMNSVIMMWMLVGITELALHVLVSPVPSIFEWIYVLLISSGCGLFAIAYLMPIRYFVWAVRALDSLTELLAYVFIRLVEIRVAQWTGRKPTCLAPQEALRSPGAAIYQSVIAIFDNRKALKLQQAQPARSLGFQLELMARPDLDYSEVVAGLRRLGFQQLLNSILPR